VNLNRNPLPQGDSRFAEDIEPYRKLSIFLTIWSFGEVGGTVLQDLRHRKSRHIKGRLWETTPLGKGRSAVVRSITRHGDAPRAVSPARKGR
jgi:hypothetical protein